MQNANGKSHRASETLGGPLKYSLAIVLITTLEWRTSVVGVIAMLQVTVKIEYRCVTCGVSLRPAATRSLASMTLSFLQDELCRICPLRCFGVRTFFVSVPATHGKADLGTLYGERTRTFCSVHTAVSDGTTS